ncbi:MAG: lytic transglycosylase domain-containing protein [Methylotenera sp.]|nr:lytic transglycosylase domain-containing protein [Oligoflexia bacterium]
MTIGEKQDLRTRLGKLLPILGVSVLAGCAGPSTPLGAIWKLGPDLAGQAELDADASERAEKDMDFEDLKTAFAPRDPEDPQVNLHPRHQVLHAARALRISIDDRQPEWGALTVKYDGFDVTDAFMNQAKVSHDVRKPGRWNLEVSDIRLSPNQLEHRIQVAYRSPSGRTATRSLAPPVCRERLPLSILRTEDFKPSKSLVRVIESISGKTGFNPSFSAALIAQESGFHSRRVSWARAIGLTQVTPLAESELLNRYPKWPQFPELNEIPVGQVKLLVLSGHVHSGNEWRLNPELSILGGLTYLQILEERWSKPENEALIRSIFRNPNRARTQLLLASYNSGYNRVLSALQRNGKGWMNSPELKEARKYVNRIISFCDHFSDKEDDDEIQT